VFADKPDKSRRSTAVSPNVLADQHADADSRQVGALQELLNSRVCLVSAQGLFQFPDSLSQNRNHIVMALFDVFHQLSEARFNL